MVITGLQVHIDISLLCTAGQLVLPAISTPILFDCFFLEGAQKDLMNL